MRLISFLNEKTKKVIKNEKLTYEEALIILKTKCKNNFEATKKGKILYRGDKSLNADSIFYLPANTRAIRKSANTENFYTLLFSKYLPSWNDYPKRDKGIICTTNYYIARSYGTVNNVFYVVPFDNCKIGICPKSDIWDSFDLSQYWIRTLNDFNYSLIEYGIHENNFNKKLNEPLSENSPIWALYHYMKQKMPNPLFNVKIDPTNLKLDNKTTLKTILNDILSPIKNDFTLISSLENLPVGSHECWFDGNAILIRR